MRTRSGDAQPQRCAATCTRNMHTMPTHDAAGVARCPKDKRRLSRLCPHRPLALAPSILLQTRRYSGPKMAAAPPSHQCRKELVRPRVPWLSGAEDEVSCGALSHRAMCMHGLGERERRGSIGQHLDIDVSTCTASRWHTNTRAAWHSHCPDALSRRVRAQLRASSSRRDEESTA